MNLWWLWLLVLDFICLVFFFFWIYFLGIWFMECSVLWVSSFSIFIGLIFRNLNICFFRCKMDILMVIGVFWLVWIFGIWGCFSYMICGIYEIILFGIFEILNWVKVMKWVIKLFFIIGVYNKFMFFMVGIFLFLVFI